MKLKVKFSILASLIFCLSCMLNDNADSFSSSFFNEDHNVVNLIDSDSQDAHHFQNGNISFSVPETQCRVPRQSNVINPTRTLSQGKRNHPVNHSRHGFTLSKSGKSMNQYTTSLFSVSINRFPSGLAESSHHLIYLGKLII